MKTLMDKPAHPTSSDGVYDGLTKVEYFASQALAGMMSNGSTPETAAKMAVHAAYALIEHLNQWEKRINDKNG